MGKYKVLKKLGQGSYGTVFLVQDSKDGCLFVMKKITVSGMTQAEVADCKREIQILSMLQHQNIIGYQRSFIRRGALCIVMDFADNGDLHHMIHKQKRLAKTLEVGSVKASFSEDLILDWFTQVALGLQHMHKHKILHRDLKTQNIFLCKSGEVRLGDFGISRVMKSTMDQARTLVGTPYYLSPEMVNGQPYNSKTDMWSLGVVLYEMLTLEHPFNADSLQMLALRIIQGNYPPIPPHYSKEINDLLSLLLEQSADKRLSIDKLLEHPLIAPRAERFRLLHAGSVDDASAMQLEKSAVLKAQPQKPASFHKEEQIPANRCIAKQLTPEAPSQHRKLASPGPRPKPTSRSTPAAADVGSPSSRSHSRSTSVQVNEDLMEEEPDWEVRRPLPHEQRSIPPPLPVQDLPKEQRSGSVQSRAFQIGILRTHLQQRLGDSALDSLLKCLRSPLDDSEKATQVDQLIKSQHEILPIVHTLIYLEQRI